MNRGNAITAVDIIDDSTRYSITELCRICRTDEGWVMEMIEEEIISADTGIQAHSSSDQITRDASVFDASQLDRLMRARRLQHDLQINAAGIAVVLALREQIDQLQREIGKACRNRG